MLTKKNYQNELGVKSKHTMTKISDSPILEMKVLDLGTKGEAIGKVDNFTYFVKGAIPGDTIKFKPLIIKKKYGIGKLLEITEKSPYRIAPKCELASRCGGCQIQEMDYQEQLKYKTKKIINSQERIAKLNCLVLPCIAMENPYHYRNKTQFIVGKLKDKVQIGLYTIYTHNIVNIEECQIMHELAALAIKEIRSFINEEQLSIYDELKHQGLLRHIVIRTSFSMNEFMVVLVLNGLDLPNQEKLITMLSKIPGFISLAYNINQDKGDAIYGHRTKIIWGKEYLTEIINDESFLVSPRSFFQVNPIQTKVLAKVVEDFIAPIGDEIMLDAYSGIGLFSLLLSKKIKKITAIESLEEAVIDAKKNAALNKIKNVEFICAKVEDILPDLVETKGFAPDIVLIDPPRKGCEETVLAAIVKINPKKIIYISCNPDTLARDLMYLANHNYHIEKIQPIDMFAHTMHIESVTLLTKK
ncbi:MAG: 23S rRNA (uracil(1939)-C(5))-methyltransferase RlmD [Candidatus Margulisiibacteriota bacterium]|jgi:23S rRNA (uracil1939-C5)-methyltransferase